MRRLVVGFMILVGNSVTGYVFGNHWYELGIASDRYHQAANDLAHELAAHQADPYIVQLAGRLVRASCELRDDVRNRCTVAEILHSWNEVDLIHCRLVSLLQRMGGHRHILILLRELDACFHALERAINCLRREVVGRPPIYQPPVYSPPVVSPPVYSPPVYSPPVYWPPACGVRPVPRPSSSYGQEYGWSSGRVGAHSDYGFGPRLVGPQTSPRQLSIDLLQSLLAPRVGR